MSVAVLSLALLIVGLIGYAVRPIRPAAAPRRLALLRASVATAASAVVVVEAAAAVHRLNAPAIAGAWLAGLLSATSAAALRLHRRPGGALESRPHPIALRHPVGLRRRAIALRRYARSSLAATPWLDRLVAGVVVALLAAVLVIAVVSEPNNYDSMTYHLPRIEHWVAQSSVDFFPTAIHRQITHSPGHEYLLTHLRLLTGGDGLYSMLQWLLAVSCILVATRIAAQLGGGRRVQLLTALMVVTIPVFAMHASGTPNDIALETWVTCVASLALDGVRRPATPASVITLGLATGLVAITKLSGLVMVVPLLALWGIGQLRLARPAKVGWGATARRFAATTAASVGLVAVAALIAGPFTVRMIDAFGTPMGPAMLSTNIPMQRHDPASVIVNGLRIALTGLDTPVPALHDASTALVRGVAAVLGADMEDPKTTYKDTRFPNIAWYPIEDLVSFPVQGVLGFVAVTWALVRPRSFTALSAEPEPPTEPSAGPTSEPVTGPTSEPKAGAWAGLGADMARSYAAAIAVGGIMFAASIKWSPSVNRLTAFLLILAAPLIAAGLASPLLAARGPHQAHPTCPNRSNKPGHNDEREHNVERRCNDEREHNGGRKRLAVRVAVVGSIAAASLVGTAAVTFGHPRGLVGRGSVFAGDALDKNLVRRRVLNDDYRWVIAQVRAFGAHRIGLVQWGNDYEYPWWTMLPGGELVDLISVLDGYPAPAPDTVEAIICTAEQWSCQEHVPNQWRLEFRRYAGYALPPAP